MRKAVRGFILVAAFASGAAAESTPRRYAECEAALRDKPTLSARVLPGARFEMVEGKIGWDRAGPLYLRHGREHVQLGSGIALTVNLGACETYANSYEFELPRADGGRGYWLARAGEMIRRIKPANRDTVVKLASLQRELEREARRSGPRRFPKAGVEGVLDTAGFGTSYEVTLRQTAKASYLTIEYRVRL